MKKTKIREIIEDNAIGISKNNGEVYSAIHSLDFDKLEKDLQEYMNKIPKIKKIKKIYKKI